MRYIVILLFCFSIASCKYENPKPIAADKSKGELIVERCIASHGGDLYDSAKMEFRFRNGVYTFDNQPTGYVYTRSVSTDSTLVVDTMTNLDLVRYVDGERQAIDSEMEEKYTQSINSVIYFATLPHKLADPAVKKRFVSDLALEGMTYHVIEVTFSAEGGGQDHDDIFYYWIDSTDYKIDFLAYSYAVNEGGVRFRTSYNRRTVGGITFQDYVNYKADLGTPLVDLPKLWKDGMLKELSKIETEDIKELY